MKFHFCKNTFKCCLESLESFLLFRKKYIRNSLGCIFSNNDNLFLIDELIYKLVIHNKILK